MIGTHPDRWGCFWDGVYQHDSLCSAMLSNGHEGLATGLYFGGGGLATALLNGIAQYFGSQIDRVEAGTAVLVAFVTLPIAIGCIAAKRYE
ncbi:MAG: hypothetical protein HC856_03285 [Pseudanabaena sp. RU_4_16]|nr:hypothetical protein [Pseudanabaena sp. RU_4_16]